MAISLSIKKLKNREYVYIVESYRDPATKRPTSRTLASFGRLDKLLAEDPDALKKIEEQVKELQSNSKAYSNRKCAKFCVCQVLEGGGRNLSPLFYDVG